LPLIRFLKELYDLKTEEDDAGIKAILTTIDADTSSMNTYINNITKNHFPYNGTYLPALLGSFGTTEGSGTLAAATITFDLLPVAAGKRYFIDSICFYTENTTTPLTALYRFLIQTKTSNTKIIQITDIPQYRMGERLPIGKISPDTGEAVEVVVTETTGAGNGLVTVFTQAGTYTP